MTPREQLLCYSTEGEPSRPTLVFVHGWPDDDSLWDSLTQALSRSFFCVKVALPGFRTSDTSAEGMDFPAIVARLSSTIREIQKEKPDKKITLVGHDWGAYISYLFEKEHPEQIKALITMDVGADLRPESIGHGLFIVSYQWWLIAAWAIGRRFPGVGNRMSRALATYGRAPRPERVHSGMNYPYYYLWRSILSSEHRERRLESYAPAVPTLYLYGERKTYMFHSEKWLKTLRSLRQSSVVALPNASHWLMLDSPDETLSAVREFLADKD